MTASGWLARVRAAGSSSPLAVALLILANLIPLAGVAFLGWDVATILILYWLENGIVGLLNVPKMLLASDRGEPLSTVGPPAGVGARAALAAFFLVHYGLFWVVHGVFVAVFAVGMSFGLGLGDPLRMVTRDSGLLLAAAALAVSHGASFLVNYVGRREYDAVSVGRQMFAPYPRMVALHVTIVIGGVAIIGARQPVLLIALLVVLKTGMDLFLHLREHSRRSVAPIVV